MALDMTTRLCPFCTLAPQRILIADEFGIVFRDAYPVSPGHTLVIPRRHTGSLFDLSDDERAALFNLVARAKKTIETEFKPSGYNLGINDGQAAGQTVPHLHVHLIPRYVGDQVDPRGGVRWIFPDKADYWSQR
jgi:diadenosine tetraphosphate (Ap4A) HIT family hydrolase